MNDPEPLPYVQPGGGLPAGAYGCGGPTEVGGSAMSTSYVDGDRRGTQDLGLLLLRIAVGALLIGHGLQKLFGWWGGPGLSGFRDSLTDVGFRYADILTYVAAGRSGRRRRAAGPRPVHPGGRGGRIGLPRHRPAGGGDGAHHEAPAVAAFLTDGHEYQVMLLRARSRRSS